MRMHRGLFAGVLAVGLVGAGCWAAGDRADTAAAAHAESMGVDQSAGIDPVVFRRDMRVLWEDHVAWTRLFIVSAVAGLGDTDATAQRLLQNQADIGDAVAEFDGNEAGDQLAALLRDHILIAGDLIAAAKAGDDTKVTDRSSAWYVNADEIAEFLAAANPAWPVDTLKDMMRGHLDQTLREAIAQLAGDYAASVAEYDHISTHILQMADTLAEGIITQFPDRFEA